MIKVRDLEIDVEAIDEGKLDACLAKLGVHLEHTGIDDRVRAFVHIAKRHIPAAVVDDCGECGAPIDSRAPRCPLCDAPVPLRDTTDLGNAERFVRDHLGKVLYCEARGGWLFYDRGEWSADPGAVERLAKQTARSIGGEAERAATSDSDEDVKTVMRHALASQSTRAIFSMLRLAQSEDGIAKPAEAFDADPMLLNTRSGVVDLRTGELHGHSPDDRHTRITSAKYHPDARSDLWERVLLESMGGDQEKVAFLQRVLGYSLTGSTAEEKFFLIHGPGATGKSTIVEAFKKTLGSYAMTAAFDTFVTAASSGPRSDIARLVGARFVSSIEVEHGRHLAEGLVKSIIGGDDVTARHLYREDFTYKPQFKLALVANDAPRADDLDTGLWRRIVRVPFEAVVPKERRDPKVKEALCNPAVSGAAILAWAVRGCLEWQRIGLAIPKSIEQATDAYRESQDPLADFFADRCFFNSTASATREQLRRAYEQWTRANGVHKPLSPKALAERLRARGVQESKRMGVRGWSGIGITLDPTDWPTVNGAAGAARVHVGARSAPVPSNGNGEGKSTTGAAGQESPQTFSSPAHDQKFPEQGSDAAPSRLLKNGSQGIDREIAV